MIPHESANVSKLEALKLEPLPAIAVFSASEMHIYLAAFAFNVRVERSFPATSRITNCLENATVNVSMPPPFSEQGMVVEMSSSVNGFWETILSSLYANFLHSLPAFSSVTLTWLCTRVSIYCEICISFGTNTPADMIICTCEKEKKKIQFANIASTGSLKPIVITFLLSTVAIAVGARLSTHKSGSPLPFFSHRNPYSTLHSELHPSPSNSFPSSHSSCPWLSPSPHISTFSPVNSEF